MRNPKIQPHIGEYEDNANPADTANGNFYVFLNICEKDFDFSFGDGISRLLDIDVFEVAESFGGWIDEGEHLKDFWFELRCDAELFCERLREIIDDIFDDEAAKEKLVKAYSDEIEDGIKKSYHNGYDGDAKLWEMAKAQWIEELEII